ncbi:Solute carrier family 52, riboflavin transporter, member 3-A [Echinococcus granulosus]|uniref:Riboflavin transporter n=1 Tax=Echinococcus granulosus TaxID=6210 RepID=A0A068WQD2_ECHGR|nr:Solute carrier family 52, riboflavin transporter, member 3-A [Echinococcus granulosus]CDS22017.1 riboflavin transporter 2 [Echinococcus granulosus]
MRLGIDDFESEDVEVNNNSTVIKPNNHQLAQNSFSWWIAVLLIFFGFSSWIAINGLWMELPLLVNLANIGPLVYVLLTRICHTFGRGQSNNGCMRLIQPPERLANYTILIVGLVASLLLMYFWNAVVVMPGLPANAVYGGTATPEALYGHSLGLFMLTFALGMIDCMSSVTFLAYLANMPAVYAGALLFGETASGLLPSLYALGQGVTTEPICLPSISQNGTTEYHPVYSPPNFGVATFMGLVAGTTGLSLLAFALLDCLPAALGRSVTLAYQRHHAVPTVPITDSTDLSKSSGSEVQSGVVGATGLFWICFLLMGYTSCMTNGLLPSLQSFSTAAYSTHTFHLAVTLSGLTAPLVALGVTAVYGYDQLGLWVRSILCCLCYRKNKSLVYDRNSPENVNKQSKMASVMGGQLAVILTLIGVIGTLFSGYIIFLAKASPSPPTLGGAGPAFSVLAWVLMTAAFNIQKTWITLHLVKHGSQRNLRTLGVANQIGSAVGALISFLITAKFNIFVSKPPCS